MITPANRTQLVNEYYFSQKLKQIEEMNSQGASVINLGIGNPDLMPPISALKVLSQKVMEPGVHGYQSYIGIPELRNAFSQWYLNFYNIHLDANGEILPLLGSKEGIMHISMAYLNPGDQVLIPNPGYPTYRSVSLLVGAEPVEYDLLPKNHWYPDFEQLEKLDLEKVKIMWVNYPHMPTGQPASMSLYNQLVAFGKKHNILICNDNPYSFILNNQPLSIFSVPGAKDIALELNSLSKSHNMAGFRVGMVAGSREHISHVLKIKSNMDSGMYKPLQLAAAKAMESMQDWYDSMNTQYRERRKWVYQIFDLLGATYETSQTGLFIWAKIPKGFDGSFEFSDYFLQEAKVFITPGAIFGSNGNQYARISLCSTEHQLQMVLSRLVGVLQKVNK
ncbi:MAG TPA: aminotransferase [Marinilabiliales bacterium]|jgi:aspartate/methionine/tyrosine aminotransferase|nr:MAG: aminotransferase [Bacteroidetes bacterium GWA2_40_14]OFX60865.1 MAG: aminotransferase [Bacteroidetes bacterium GWC2_40_13]OFX71519.1 MAG: aminotransferase [Bacteroidetes bacterium GWD2_40_43]OFX95553.1 MAG: aminotransferase [Bacteroidetes bacterium GWE2_40_63]OFY22289.1 MAG: aminotransferase [Bacteroidetes bacterium GWF2_40_13]OFZ24925.1 MAG: aminotransferase [Bacteroidetes bacterium RIFOXYC2_FULL_40_12]HAM99995.1 aminotransferase [Marinilabiliales bacterium]